jgi:hypothetical protein
MTLSFLVPASEGSDHYVSTWIPNAARVGVKNNCSGSCRLNREELFSVEWRKLAEADFC